jgi:hypothetical protein
MRADLKRLRLVDILERTLMTSSVAALTLEDLLVEKQSSIFLICVIIKFFSQLLGFRYSEGTLRNCISHVVLEFRQRNCHSMGILDEHGCKYISQGTKISPFILCTFC